MKIEYQYFKDNGYLISTPRGSLTLQDVKDYISALSNDSSITAPFFEVVKFRHVKEFEFGYSEVSELMPLLQALTVKKGYKGSILVVENDLSKSMSNIVRSTAKELGIMIRTFRNAEDACIYAELNNT